MPEKTSADSLDTFFDLEIFWSFLKSYKHLVLNIVGLKEQVCIRDQLHLVLNIVSYKHLVLNIVGLKEQVCIRDQLHLVLNIVSYKHLVLNIVGLKEPTCVRERLVTPCPEYSVL